MKGDRSQKNQDRYEGQGPDSEDGSDLTGPVTNPANSGISVIRREGVNHQQQMLPTEHSDSLIRTMHDPISRR